jgi:hypothetical protein
MGFFIVVARTLVVVVGAVSRRIRLIRRWVGMFRRCHVCGVVSIGMAIAHGVSTFVLELWLVFAFKRSAAWQLQRGSFRLGLFCPHRVRSRG